MTGAADRHVVRAARRPALFAIFGILNALAGGAAVYALARTHFSVSFFNDKIPLEERVNETMIEYKAPALPTALRFVFDPRESAPVMYALFNFSALDGSFTALRVSSRPERPTAWITVRGGHATRVRELDSPNDDQERDWEIGFADGRVRGKENGWDVLDEPFRLEETSVYLLLSPSYVFGTACPPWWALRRFEVATAGEGGDPVWKSMSSRFASEAGIVLVALAFFALWVLVDHRVSAGLVRRFGPRGALACAYALVPTLAFLALWAYFYTWEQAKRAAADLHWYAPFLQDGVFDEAAFRAAPVLHRDGEDMPIGLDPDVMTVVAHGGSTTFGYPYGRGRWDWPTRLREMLQADPDRGGRRVQVLNLSHNSDLLQTNFPAGVEGFYRVVRPAVVVVNSVINNYYTYRPTETAWHGLGLWSYRAKGEDARALVEYRAQWRRVLGLIRDAGAKPVVVIPALDNDAFPDGSPMSAWQDATAEEAGTLDATVVDTRPIFDAAPGRWVWWEFMHPNRLGYAMVARAVADALLADDSLWTPADEPVVAGDAGGE